MDIHERKTKPNVEPKPWDYLGWQGEQPTIDDLPCSASLKADPVAGVVSDAAVEALREIAALADRKTSSAPTPTWRRMGEIAKEALAEYHRTTQRGVV